MDGLAKLPDDMVFFTQITMEAAEDPAFPQAMARARIRGALVGVEAATPEGLKDVHKGFNLVGEPLVERLQTFRSHGIHVLGSFIFGLLSDRPETFEATADLAERAGITFAQFVMLTPYPGTVDFERWERKLGADAATVSGIPVTRHWLIPQADRPKAYAPHPVMSPDEIRRRTQAVWDHFYALPRIWRRSRVARSWKGRLAFVLSSKLYRQMYANTGIATDSARRTRSVRVARWMARPCAGSLPPPLCHTSKFPVSDHPVANAPTSAVCTSEKARMPLNASAGSAPGTETPTPPSNTSRAPRSPAETDSRALRHQHGRRCTSASEISQSGGCRAGRIPDGSGRVGPRCLRQHQGTVPAASRERRTATTSSSPA